MQNETSVRSRSRMIGESKSLIQWITDHIWTWPACGEMSWMGRALLTATVYWVVGVLVSFGLIIGYIVSAIIADVARGVFGSVINALGAWLALTALGFLVVNVYLRIR